MATQQPDWYAVLGVPSTASADEIRQAFRQAALRLHPDKAGAAAASAAAGAAAGVASSGSGSSACVSAAVQAAAAAAEEYHRVQQAWEVRLPAVQCIAPLQACCCTSPCFCCCSGALGCAGGA